MTEDGHTKPILKEVKDQEVQSTRFYWVRLDVSGLSSVRSSAERTRARTPMAAGGRSAADAASQGLPEIRRHGRWGLRYRRVGHHAQGEGGSDGFAPQRTGSGARRVGGLEGLLRGCEDEGKWCTVLGWEVWGVPEEDGVLRKM